VTADPTADLTPAPTPGRDARRAALEPLRAALITRAHAEASRIREDADAAAQQVIAAARDEAAAVLARARADGEAEAAALLEAEAARSRQVARSLVLAARRATYDEARVRARSAVRALLADGQRRARLAAALRARLGGVGAVRDHPDGGLVAETGDGRSIDASAGALVDTVISAKDVEQLWASR